MNLTHTRPPAVPASAPLRAVVLTSIAELEQCRDEWNELLHASEADSIFLTWEWISTWLQTVMPRAAIRVVCVRDPGGRLVALAPFYLARMRLLRLIPYRCLRVLGDYSSGADYPDVIVRRGWESPAAAAIRGALRFRLDWDCGWFANVASWRGADVRLRESLRSQGGRCRTRPRDFAAVVLPPTQDQFLAMFSHKARGNVRRNTRRVLQMGDVEVVSCLTVAEVPRFLCDLFELHRKRWEAEGQSGSFVRKPRMARFYEGFAPLALRAGWLRVLALRRKGGTLAIQYGYAYNGSYAAMQEGFDPRSPKGIGNALRHLVFQACIEEGLDTYDFLGGMSEHKRLWRAVERAGCDMLIARNTRKGRLLFAREIWPSGRFVDFPDMPRVQRR